jgi:hypothetical protein
MNYSKPEVTLLDDAALAIQGFKGQATDAGTGNGLVDGEEGD